MKKWLTNALLALVFLAGLSIALYPTVSNQFNLYRASLLISRYHFDLQELTPEDHSDMIAACDEYNAKLWAASFRMCFPFTLRRQTRNTCRF